MSLESERIRELGQTTETIFNSRHNSLGGEWIIKPESDTVFLVYEELGKIFDGTIKKSFVKICEDKGGLGKRIDRANRVFTKLREIAALDSDISQFVQDYLNALWGWSEGAGIEKYCDIYGVGSPLLAALMLQDDNTGGCQTAIVRVSKDMIIMAHSEEDVNVRERMTISPLAEIDIKGKKHWTVLYNDLLPGSATYGASGGFAVSCDFLRVKDIKESDGLVNVLSWVIWRMGNEATVEKITDLVKKMGPFNDAYVINVVKSEQGSALAFRITCAGDEFVVEDLPENPGASLVQVNVIDPRYKDIAPKVARYSQEKEDMDKGYWEHYMRRISDIRFLISRYASYGYLKAANNIPGEQVHNMILNLMSTGYSVEDGWGVANVYCGMAVSTIIRQIGAESGSVVFNLGPSIRGKKDFRKVVKI